jgi:transposase
MMGHSRDGKPGEPQIVYGLLCAPDGCPVAIEVFSGNTADPTTFTAQVNSIRRRFGITRVVLVGDRGMMTSKRIKEDLRDVEGLDWIGSLLCGTTASRSSSSEMRFSYRCSTSATWRKSRRRTIRASG